MASGSKAKKSAEVIFLHGVRYERDPLSAVFEDLPDEELEMMAESIRAEGQKQPITINSANGLVLDGWQRLRACELINAKPKIDEAEIPNPAAFVMAVNEHRRGSTAPSVTKRALLATDLLMLEWESRGGKGRKPSVPRVAEAAGVSPRVVEQIRRALRYDSRHNTDFEERMRAGLLSAGSSHAEIVTLEKEAAKQQANAQGGTDTASPATLRPSVSEVPQLNDAPVPEVEWKEELRECLIAMSPSGFERFTATLLKEDGFIDVKVTGGTGDGGIDGIAVQSRIDPVSIAFQCKRYRGSVGAPEIRDFRGSFVGRCDRGLFITTGTFTRSAKDEAERPGAHPVRLIDGDTLCDLLKEHKLGVHVEIVEQVTVDDFYFAQFEDAQ